MKILMVNYEWPPLGGGGGVAMRDIALELAREHTVHVLTSGAPGLATEETSVEGRLRVFRCPAWLRRSHAVASVPSMLSFYPSGVRLGRELVDRFGYDVVNTWFAIPSGPTGSAVARYGRLPHLLTIIGGDIYDPSKWYSPHRNPLLGRVVRAVLAGADRHTAISADIANRARSEHRFQRPIDVIPLGIREPCFCPADRGSLAMDASAKYIIAVGRLVRRKNYPSLLRALPLLRRPDVKLMILGDGPELPRLRALAAELDLADKLEFRGFVPEQTKYQLLSCADVFALPSHHEGFGLVFLEAMYCGLPVVASTVGGQRDFLVDGTTGYLVAPQDTPALAAALGKLLQDDHARPIAESNRRLVTDYLVPRTAQRYESLLQEVCALSEPPA